MMVSARTALQRHAPCFWHICLFVCICVCGHKKLFALFSLTDENERMDKFAETHSVLLERGMKYKYVCVCVCASIQESLVGPLLFDSTALQKRAQSACCLQFLSFVVKLEIMRV